MRYSKQQQQKSLKVSGWSSTVIFAVGSDEEKKYTLHETRTPKIRKWFQFVKLDEWDNTAKQQRVTTRQQSRLFVDLYSEQTGIISEQNSQMVRGIACMEFGCYHPVWVMRCHNNELPWISLKFFATQEQIDDSVECFRAVDFNSLLMITVKRLSSLVQIKMPLCTLLTPFEMQSDPCICIQNQTPANLEGLGNGNLMTVMSVAHLWKHLEGKEKVLVKHLFYEGGGECFNGAP